MRLVVFAVALLVATSCTESEGALAETPASEQEEIDTLRARADQGVAEAQYNLGVMYARGDGVPEDEAEALRWYRRAAEQGYAEAQTSLGFYYREGLGVPQDYAEALRWLRRAVEQGQELAMIDLGSMPTV